MCHNHPDPDAAASRCYLRDLHAALPQSDDFEPLILARAGHRSRRRRPAPRHADHDGQSRPQPVSDVHGLRRLRLLLGRLPPSKQVLTRVLPRLPARPAAGRRALPAHRLHRLRHGAGGAQHAAGRADRLLAARVPADLPPRRPDGPHQATTSSARRSRRGAATSASRTSAAADLLHAQALHPVPPSLVDHFIAPSDYVRERYVDWGIPARQDPGGAARACAGHRPRRRSSRTTRPRNRFAFFGQLTPYKGADVLLEAMERPGRRLRRPPVDLRREPREAARRVPGTVRRLLENERENVTFGGSYERVATSGS